MVIMRGVPGSGKSYLARKIIDQTMNGDYENHIFSSDDFFLNRRTGRYVYNRELIGQAHEFNQSRVAQRALSGWSPIIIDNTNVKLWEMFPYVNEGVRYGYTIKILEPNTSWSKSAGKLAMKNEHNVPKDKIERMLNDFERTTVNELLRLLKLNYSCPLPQLRSYPLMEQPSLPPEESSNAKPVTTQPSSTDDPDFNSYCFVESNVQELKNVTSNVLNMPKEQRKSGTKNVINSESATSAVSKDEANPFQVAALKLEQLNDEWTTFEEERDEFWNPNGKNADPQKEKMPKPQRQPTEKSINDIYNLLRREPEDTVTKTAGKEEAMVPLKKHEKGCTNENESFQQIRQIYPTIPISLLWDLFEKCNGDGDWTMDILLNEETTNSFKKLESESDIQRDNFLCECRSSVSLELQQAANAIPAELLCENTAPPLLVQPNRSRREPTERICENEVRKQIEEQFVISDEHYSSHVRKIRDFRRGIIPPTTIPVASTSEQMQNENDIEMTDGAAGERQTSSPPTDENCSEDDDIIEMDLGVELVCQLDSVFGVNAFQRDNLRDIKTTVFMPKSLGQQLYAIWMESLYNQLEEQRQKSVKDDEEFAKELHIKQNYPQLLQDKPPNNLKDVMDMEYAWKAYKADVDEWKKTTPQDLASKLTRAKLFEIFPNVEKDTLVEILAAHGNNFAKTVEVLKGNLKSDIGDKIQVESQQLLNQARVESQAVSKKY